MKMSLIMFLLLLATISANAKVAPSKSSANGVGVRFGSGSDGSGGEISYQKGLGKNNRAEFDLGFAGEEHSSIASLAAIYQWGWNIDGGFNWYAGVGGQLGIYSYDNNNKNSDGSSGLTVGVGGQLGIEYNFTKIGAPLLLSLDGRPMFNFINHGGVNSGVAFSIRYLF